MDPVTGIGLAAAVIQLIEVSTKITKRLIEFSSADLENGPPKSFENIMTVLPLITEGLRNVETNLHQLPEQTQRSLNNVVQRCLKDIQDLNAILDKALPSSNASSWEKTKKALASLRYDSKVEEISQAIDRCMKALTFYQLSEISQNIRAEQPSPQEKVYWLVPFDRNAAFVERSAIFKEIENSFKVGEGVQPKAALHGLGGIGKSQIALEYCYRRHKQHPHCSIFWCNAATTARFEQSLGRIAVECGLVSEGTAEIQISELIKQWLESQYKGQWLMVVDNIDDKDVFFTQKLRSGQTISECIPHCANGFLLFTTRSREVAFDVLQQTSPIMMKQMNKEEGSELARKRLPKDTPEHLIINLLQVLEFIPLAITQASAFIRKRGKTVQYYLDQFDKSDSTKAKLLSYEFSDHGRQENSMESLAKTWMISFEAIQEANPRAAELLCLMSFFQHHGVPTILLRREEEDEADFDDAIAVLESFSFINADGPESVLRMHRLVQLATRWWQAKENPSESERWELMALESVANQFPHIPLVEDPNNEYFTFAEILLHHAGHVLQNEIKQPSPEADILKAKLLYSTGIYSYYQANWSEARSRLEQSRKLYVKHLGEQHISTMDSTCFAAAAGTYLEDPKSIGIFKRLLKLQEDVLGENDYRTIHTMSGLAEAMCITHSYETSEYMQRQALARSTQAFSTRHECTLNCMTRLAVLLDKQSRSAEAAELLRECHNTELNLSGPLSYRSLGSERTLASVLSHCEETYDEACELYTHIVSRSRETLGHDDYHTLCLTNELAWLLSRIDRPESLRSVCIQVLRDIENGSRKKRREVQELKADFELFLEGVEDELGLK